MFNSVISFFLGSKPQQPTKKTTNLHRAVIDGNLEAFERFFDTNGSVEIDTLNEDNYTALALSIIHKRDEMLDRLMKRHANPHIPKDYVTHQAFNVAVMHDAPQEIIKKIVRYSSFYRSNRELINSEKERICSTEISGYDFVDPTPNPLLTEAEEKEYEVVNSSPSGSLRSANVDSLTPANQTLDQRFLS